MVKSFCLGVCEGKAEGYGKVTFQQSFWDFSSNGFSVPCSSFVSLPGLANAGVGNGKTSIAIIRSSSLSSVAPSKQPRLLKLWRHSRWEPRPAHSFCKRPHRMYHWVDAGAHLLASTTFGLLSQNNTSLVPLLMLRNLFEIKRIMARSIGTMVNL